MTTRVADAESGHAAYLSAFEIADHVRLDAIAGTVSVADSAYRAPLYEDVTAGARCGGAGSARARPSPGSRAPRGLLDLRGRSNFDIRPRAL